jgi:hypothetical protein
MLPDFVGIKRKRAVRFDKLLIRETEKRSGVLPHNRTVQQHEGRRIDYTTVDGERDEVTYDKRISTSLQFSPEELPLMDAAWFLRKAGVMAEDMARQQMGMFFDKVDEVTEKAGTVTRAKGRPFDPMMLIECIEKTEIDFDENKQPILQTLVVHPSMAQQVEKVLADAGQSAEFQAGWNELMQRKWIAFRDREADRKLVD